MQWQIILDLKRRALELKRAGDLDGAKQLLAEARQVEFEGAGATTMDDLTDPTKLQQLAVFLKTAKGDIEGAKKALLKARQLQRQATNQHQEATTTAAIASNRSSNNNCCSESANSFATTVPPEQVKGEQAVETTNVRKNGDEKDNNINNDVIETSGNNDDDEEHLLAELTGKNNDEGGDDSLLREASNVVVTFTLEEMQDEEMMVEFKLGGMPVPSDEDYRAKILERKKAALAHKQKQQPGGNNDLSAALTCLQQSKQLEKVRVALSLHVVGELGLRINDDDDAWIETLTDEERQLLLGDTYGFAGTKNANDNNNFLNATQQAALDLEDLAEMDATTLLDMMELMPELQIPAVADVLSQVNDKKKQALEFKAAGDTAQAVQILRESKELQVAAKKLETILREVEQLQKNRNGGGGEGNISEEALEALLAGSDDNKNNGTNKQNNSSADATPQPKTAEEWKQQAILLRNAKRITEATQALKSYKEALKKEARAAEQERRTQAVADLEQERLLMIQTQLRLIQFFQRFVNEGVGTDLWKRWKAYDRECVNTIASIQQQPIDKHLPVLTRKKSNLLLRLDNGTVNDAVDNDTICTFLQKGADPTEERLEISLLDVRGLKANKTMQKIIKGGLEEQQEGNTNNSRSSFLRVTVTLQLPPSEEESDKTIDLTLESEECTELEREENEICYHFQGSHYANLPVRGNSRFAKKMLHRMERRRVQIAIHYVPVIKQQQKGWIGGMMKNNSEQHNTNNNDSTVLLGMVVLNLKDLLTSNCVAGDFPLTRSSGSSSKTVGGTAGLCLRTGVPFDPEKTTLSVIEEKQEARNRLGSPLLPYEDAIVFPFLENSEAPESS